MISKETFVSAINQIKAVNEYHEKLNSLFEEYGADGYVYPPTCIDNLVMVLEEGMEIEPNEYDNTDVSYFVYELDCGKSWKPGCVTDVVDGKEIEIDMSTPEKFYDYLIGKYNKSKSKAGETTE